MPSPFLAIPEAAWVAANELAFAVRDRYPVSDGHTLVIPRREVPTWFEATREEQLALLALVDEVKRQLDEELRPDGYNIGINAGEAAGQTVMHLHVHVIPRFRGDVDDPRGGVRHVIPGRGNYLAGRAAPLATGGPGDPFLRHLGPLFAEATRIAVIAAFVQESGLALLEPRIRAALARGAEVRLITGDYLDITQAAALEDLLDWTNRSAARDEAEGAAGRFEARVVEMKALSGESPTFHPKSWRFEGNGWGAAFVGSSNISRAALGAGVEWNLRVERGRDPEAYRRVAEAFERWWTRARPLDAQWVAAYADRARRVDRPLPAGEAAPEPLEPPPAPHDIQRAALDALDRARAEGRRRTLVVLATGLGKTWLAAWDAAACAAPGGAFPRVLFLAHREELLAQAARTFRRLLRQRGASATITWFLGDRSDLDGRVVLASVQKLARPEHLARLRAEVFDYVIVDEVHHGAAPSYRRVLDLLDPGFLLGLTATPERADGADVLGLFDDHVAYEADLGVGITRGLLVPFAYHGLRDDVDYRNIPWRNRRFDPEALAAAVETEQRMQTLWRAWEEHRGTRTLVFCCSIRHAEVARDWLRGRGVRAEAIHTGPGSADRDEAQEALRDGRIDAICAVDLFNEGVDLPAIDRVVMLRPTESMVVFLQQLGRGLRRHGDKRTLVVIDFVGNHRIFVDRIRRLVSLGGRAVSLRAWLAGEQEESLPPGCSVDVKQEAKDILDRLLPAGQSAVEQAYHELRAARGERPTLGELHRLGYVIDPLRKAYGGWFDFLAAQQDRDPDNAEHLSSAERRALEVGRGWLRELEVTPMSKCFKMVTLEALLEAGALREGLPIPDLARRSHALLRRSPELLRDVEAVKALPDPQSFDGHFIDYWRTNPITAWAGEDRKSKGDAWFRCERREGAEWLVSRLPFPPEPDAAEAFAEMTRELVDYRLARYRYRIDRSSSVSDAFEAKVTWNQRDPILKLPARAKRPDIPEGEHAVRLAPGPGRPEEVLLFKFAKEFCNVARRRSGDTNRLPDLLRGWFGPTAGQPSTSRHVRFVPTPEGLWAEPVPVSGAASAADAAGEGGAPGGLVIAFPSLRAAAGGAGAGVELEPEAERIRLRLSPRADGRELFAVRAAGDSMDGGREPIRDGDWLVMRYAREMRLGGLEGRIALVQVPDAKAGFGHGYQVKRVVRQGGRWTLRSENPARPSFAASAETVPIAVLAEVVRPEAMAPETGDRIAAGEIGKAFGLEGEPAAGQAARVEGHLFLLVEEEGRFTEPERLRWEVKDRRPGETAFVLVRAPGEAAWRYLGVGRWIEEEGAWGCPELDFQLWRALGEGRGASRRLPEEYREKARAFVERTLEKLPAGSVVDRDGKRFRIVRRSADGGLLIDGGPGGFKERTVSTTDLGWVLLAVATTGASPGKVDEATVNRLRYLEGTPRESTRWIDTGWAIRIVRL